MVGAACVFLATKVEENLIHTDSVVEAAFKAAGRPPPKVRGAGTALRAATVGVVH